MLAFAIDRIDIANYVSALFTVYIVLIFLYILLNLVFSFGLRLPYARWSDVVMNFLRDVCEPYLRIFRRFIPTLVMFGDHLDIKSDIVNWKSSYDGCNAYAEKVKAAGGDITMMLLPAMGIKGNSHMLMQDKNNLQVADLILGWLDKHVDKATYENDVKGFVDLAFTDPWFLGQRLAVGAELFGRQTFANSNQAFNTSLYGAKFSAGTPITDNLAVNWNYSIYNQGVSLSPAIGTVSLPIQQAAQAGAYWVSSVGNGVTYSTLDNPKDPTTGVWARTNNEFAGLGGAAKFARNTEDVRLYHPIVGDLVGVVHAQGGYVTPWGGQQLPLLSGFFGGPQLVRGFAPNGFGPRDITPGTTMDNLGGNVYLTTSAEFQAPMPFVPPEAQLKIALFSDTGSLWATNASTVPSLATSLSPAQQIANSRALRSSIGASLIWDSMFGPIRVDYAYPIAKQNYDVTQRFQFHAGAF